MYAVLNITWFT